MLFAIHVYLSLSELSASFLAFFAIARSFPIGRRAPSQFSCALVCLCVLSLDALAAEAVCVCSVSIVRGPLRVVDAAPAQ